VTQLGYLEGGLLAGNGPRRDLEAQVLDIAALWAHAGVDPARIELTAELLARLADALAPDARIEAADVAAAISFIEPPQQLLELVTAASAKGVDRRELAALAVHLIDIAERAALEIFLPELPALEAKSDRSAASARHVGVARHLKG
jgi:hypothetical protein